MLPKIQVATFEYELPISKKKIHYRPYTVKEEKILLIAAASNSSKDMVNAVKQVISNCIQEEDVDISTLPIFDLEVLLTLLRIVSTSNEIDLTYIDTEDNKEYKFTINLEEVIENVVKNAKPVPKDIPLKENIGIVMRDLTIDVIMSGELENLNDPEKMYDVFYNLIESVYDDETVYPIYDQTKEEFTEFLDSFDKESSAKLSSYFTSMPKLSHTIKYTNSKGTVREIRLEGITDFFQ